MKMKTVFHNYINQHFFTAYQEEYARLRKKYIISKLKLLIFFSLFIAFLVKKHYETENLTFHITDLLDKSWIFLIAFVLILRSFLFWNRHRTYEKDSIIYKYLLPSIAKQLFEDVEYTQESCFEEDILQTISTFDITANKVVGGPSFEEDYFYIWLPTEKPFRYEIVRPQKEALEELQDIIYDDLFLIKIMITDVLKITRKHI